MTGGLQVQQNMAADVSGATCYKYVQEISSAKFVVKARIFVIRLGLSTERNLRKLKAALLTQASKIAMEYPKLVIVC